jgi:hypothetical protein
MAIGMATSLPGERLETVARRADHKMFEAKREYYARLDNERRSEEAAA